MKIGELLKREFTISFEFSPPKTEESEREFWETIALLKPMNPHFVTVTYGAGGSTRDKTRDIVLRLYQEQKLNVMPHLTAVNHSAADVIRLLDSYKAAGIDDILALRGDTPQGTAISPGEGEIPHAVDLVHLIRERYGRYFSIGGAAFPERHPESSDWDSEIRHFKEKVDAGLDFATTQLFFKNEFFYSYRDRLARSGIDIPVLPGIMPIINYKGIKRMAELSHAFMPPELLEKIEKVSDKPEEVEKIGVEYTIRQCEELLNNGVPGLHLYTMNKSRATLTIYSALRSSIPGRK